LADSTIYAHAVGRIWTIENKMLRRNTLERMIDAGSPEGALKVLIDTGYVSGMDNIGIWDFEKLLRNARKEVYSLLVKITPDPVAIKPFLGKWDFHNARVIVKGEVAGVAYANYLVDVGTLPVEDLVTAIREREYGNLPVSLSEAIKESLEVFNKTGDPQLVDFLFESAAHKQIVADAEETLNDFVKGLFRVKTDLINIKTFIRLKRAGVAPEYLERTLMDGGSLERNLFIESLDGTYENFLASVKRSPYGDLCEKALGTFASTGSLSEFERLSDNMLIDYVSKSRYMGVGMEPLVAYLVAREIEATNIRIILVGMVNGVPHDNIRGRLRRTYV
jgi:V/A-type H+-transporting ATPase subunit C